MLLLSPEEIEKIVDGYVNAIEGYVSDEDNFEYETGAAVAKVQLKKVVEWGDAYCAEQNRPRRECGHCWQALKKELE